MSYVYIRVCEREKERGIKRERWKREGDERERERERECTPFICKKLVFFLGSKHNCRNFDHNWDTDVYKSMDSSNPRAL